MIIAGGLELLARKLAYGRRQVALPCIGIVQVTSAARVLVWPMRLISSRRLPMPWSAGPARLGWKTPAEALNELLSTAQYQPVLRWPLEPRGRDGPG